MYHVYTVYTPMNYTPWNPIYSHHYDFKITFEWPPTNWYSIWHIFWHYIWHSSWHIFWHSIWHSFWQIYCDIPSGILFGILSDIYSDILSGILSGKYIVTFPSGILSGLPFCLAFYWYIFWHSIWHSMWRIILTSIQHCLWHSIWHLISWDVNCRIRGGGGGWGGILGGQDAALIKSRDPEWPWPGRWGKIKSGWWSTYPSEKWWSVVSWDVIPFPINMESHSKFHGSSHHQPESEPSDPRICKDKTCATKLWVGIPSHATCPANSQSAGSRPEPRDPRRSYPTWQPTGGTKNRYILWKFNGINMEFNQEKYF